MAAKSKMAANMRKMVWRAKYIYMFTFSKWFLLLLFVRIYWDNKQLNLVHSIESKMATKFKMAAIYQKLACRYEQLLLLRIKYPISVRYGFENKAKYPTAVQ